MPHWVRGRRPEEGEGKQQQQGTWEKGGKRIGALLDKLAKVLNFRNKKGILQSEKKRL